MQRQLHAQFLQLSYNNLNKNSSSKTSVHLAFAFLFQSLSNCEPLFSFAMQSHIRTPNRAAPGKQLADTLHDSTPD